jgi:uncharacterized protein (TIGR03066 family)
MKCLLAAFAAATVLVGASLAEDKKIDPAKLVGKWEWSKSDDPNAPKGAIVEFSKDNKLTISGESMGEKFNYKGTYKVDGDKLTVKLAGPDGKENEDTDTIQTLTDEKLVLVDKDKKTNELAKKK